MDDTTLARFMAKVDRTGDCWVWTGGKHKAGYGMFWNNGIMDSAHRLSYLHHHGEIPVGFVVRHKCLNKCVNPDHLEVGTYHDNMMDRKRDGNFGVKLTADQVLEIRRRANENTQQLATEFGVGRSAIQRIVYNRTWKV